MNKLSSFSKKTLKKTLEKLERRFDSIESELPEEIAEEVIIFFNNLRIRNIFLGFPIRERDIKVLDAISQNFNEIDGGETEMLIETEITHSIKRIDSISDLRRLFRTIETAISLDKNLEFPIQFEFKIRGAK